MPRRGVSPFAIASLLAGSAGLWALFAANAWLLGGVAAAYAIAVGLGVTFARLRFFCDTVCRGVPGSRRVALTFDDGPDPRVTPRILEVLKEHGIPAAFFGVGKRALECPELARRIVAEGHLLENHTFRHAWWTNFLVGGPLRREIERGQQALREATGTAPRYYRSPMGLTNPHTAGALRALKLQPVGWDVRTFDRKARHPERVVNRAVRKVRDGSIVLLHDGGVSPDEAVSIVNGLVRELGSRGYRLVRLDELLQA